MGPEAAPEANRSEATAQEARRAANRRKVREQRQLLRAQGMRPIQIWVPDEVVPITGTPASGSLYPRPGSDAHGLTKPSYALVNQLRSIDKRRIRRRHGQVSEAELAAIDAGLWLYLGREPNPD